MRREGCACQKRDLKVTAYWFRGRAIHPERWRILWLLNDYLRLIASTIIDEFTMTVAESCQKKRRSET